ncbi:MAG: hypothetical protein QNJ41_10040 [Xenococcaceae cyanobacterium MO_188.B32]|nr:hypothetical protein [Xenococcaceae cyanobacterium MO_188.B32]
MVYEDIDPPILVSVPNLYRLLKVSSDRTTDKMSMSSDTKGQNMDFRTFCPKIFSSISAIHNDENFKELQRRLIVIPFKKIEDLSDERLKQLGTSRATWQNHLINIDAYHWDGFSSIFANFWTKKMAEIYLLTKKTLAKTLSGLSSRHRAISLDLLASGITAGVWASEKEAIVKLKSYFEWYMDETNKYAGIKKYLADYLAIRGFNGVSSRELYRQINIWLDAGWILEKPKPRQLKSLMADLGLVLYEGFWVKR